MQRKLRLMLILIVALLTLCGAGAFIWVPSLQACDRQHSDFTRFCSAQEVKDYLIESLPLESTTAQDVVQFVAEAQITHCWLLSANKQPLQSIQADDSLRCTVDAPAPSSAHDTWIEQLEYAIACRWEYLISFELVNARLTAINVGMGDLCW